MITPSIPTPAEPVVMFQPSGAQGRIPNGTTVQEAARALGVDLEGICHGRGRCLKCRVRISSGQDHVTAPTLQESIALSLPELQDGYRLACQARVTGDVEVAVPATSVPGKHIMRKSLHESDYQIDPSVRLHAITLSAPSLNDQRSDLSRIAEALQREHHLPALSISYRALKDMPHVARDSGWQVEVIVREDHEIVQARMQGTGRLYGLAIDIGTTTVVGYLIDLGDGRIMATHALINPQIGFGEDVMSRITHCAEHPEGLAQLQRLIVEAVVEIVQKTTSQAGIPLDHLFEVSIVGNTCMHHLFLGLDPVSLGKSPFAPVISAPYEVMAQSLTELLPVSATVYCLPIIGGFVGADTVGVLLATQPWNTAGSHLVIDIGTNGELVLATGTRLLACSVATGPAFEGAHVRCGMRAAPGAIEHISITSDLEVSCSIIGGSKPLGICGTGIISGVAELFERGALDRSGKFNPGLSTSRIRKRAGGLEFVVCWSHETNSGDEIVITQDDVVSIQVAKAALYAGAKVLMKEAGVKALDHISLAGAFGSFIDPWSAYRIGMFPDCDPDHVFSVGNAAGEGAVMALLSRTAKARAAELAQEVEYRELTLDHSFEHEFAAALMLPHLHDSFSRL